MNELVKLVVFFSLTVYNAGIVCFQLAKKKNNLTNLHNIYFNNKKISLSVNPKKGAEGYLCLSCTIHMITQNIGEDNKDIKEQKKHNKTKDDLGRVAIFFS